MTRFFLLLLVCLLGTGCAKLAHLQQLLTLKAYSEDKDRQEEFVRQHNERFGRLMEAVRDQTITRYETRQQILRDFGPPVFKRKEGAGGQGREQWLYREATAYFEGDRVYFYFDNQGNMTDWEYVNLPSVS